MLFIPEKGAILTFVLNESKIQSLHFQTFCPGIDFLVVFRKPGFKLRDLFISFGQNNY